MQAAGVKGRTSSAHRSLKKQDLPSDRLGLIMSGWKSASRSNRNPKLLKERVDRGAYGDFCGVVDTGRIIADRVKTD